MSSWSLGISTLPRAVGGASVNRARFQHSSDHSTPEVHSAWIEHTFSVRLRSFVHIQEDDQSSGVPEPIEDDHPEWAPQAGVGPVSNGVPSQIGGQPRGKALGAQPDPSRAKTQLSIPSDPSRSKTQPLINFVPPTGLSRQQPSPKRPQGEPSTSGDPKGKLSIRQSAPTRQLTPPSPAPPTPSAVPKSAQMAVHPWGQEEPAPDLPLEGRLTEVFGLDEMPRPKGSFAPPMKAVINWASQQPGEFTAKDMFRIFRAAGGQPNQPNDTAAYMSFQSAVKRLKTDGRPSEDTPLVVSKVGQVGRGGSTVYRWGLKGGAKSSPNPIDIDQPGATVPGVRQSVKPKPPGDWGGQALQALKNHSGDDEEELDDDDLADPNAEPENERPAGMPSWMPTPDIDGAGAEYAIAKLADNGIEINNPLWKAVANSETSAEAINRIRATSPTAYSLKVKVAKGIFQNLGKSWDD